MEKETGKYNALDVARYIVNYSWKEKKPVSNLKLQKLLYFVQAKFLISSDGEACFSDEIEAWAFGPVVPNVYHEFKKYGASIIPEIDYYIDFSDGIWNAKKVDYKNDIIKEIDQEIINKTVDELSDYSASMLVDITHKQKPWCCSYSKGKNNVIPKKVIKEYFI